MTSNASKIKDIKKIVQKEMYSDCQGASAVALDILRIIDIEEYNNYFKKDPPSKKDKEIEDIFKELGNIYKDFQTQEERDKAFYNLSQRLKQIK